MKFSGKQVLSRLVNASYSKIRWLLPADFLGGGGDPGEVYFNSYGQLGHDSGFVYSEVNKTINLGGGTLTASDPVLDLSQTWNDAGVTFTGLKFNVTNTASAAASLLQDWQVGGSSVLNVRRNGYIYSGASYLGLADHLLSFNSNEPKVTGYGGIYLGDHFSSGALFVTASYSPVTGAVAVSARNQSNAAFLSLALSASQTYIMSGAAWTTTNYERLAILPGVAVGWMQIAAETGGTGTDNIGIALTPAGTGAISAQVPDSTAAGGNARGTNSVDWQTYRGSAVHVASGARSVIGGGAGNAATGSQSAVLGGESNSATAFNSAVVGGSTNWIEAGVRAFIGGGFSNQINGDDATIAGGHDNAASAANAVVSGGMYNLASGVNSWIPGGLQATTRGLRGTFAYSSGARSVQGDAQVIGQPVRVTTSAASLATLTTDGAAVSATNCMILPVNSGCKFTAELTAVHAAGAAVGGWKIEGTARRGAAGDATVVNVNTTAFAPDAALGAPVVTVVANVGGAGAGGIVIAVTPANDTTTYWVGKIELVQAA